MSDFLALLHSSMSQRIEECEGCRAWLVIFLVSTRDRARFAGFSFVDDGMVGWQSEGWGVANGSDGLATAASCFAARCLYGAFVVAGAAPVLGDTPADERSSVRG